MIMEAEQFWDLLTNWRPRRADDVVPLQKEDRLKIQDELMFQFKYKGRKNPRSQQEAVRPEQCPLSHRRISLFVFFRSSTYCTGPTHIRDNDLLCCLPIHILDSYRKVLTDTSRIVFGQMSKQPVAQSSWHKINHHTTILPSSTHPRKFGFFFKFFVLTPNVSNLPLQSLLNKPAICIPTPSFLVIILVTFCFIFPKMSLFERFF